MTDPELTHHHVYLVGRKINHPMYKVAPPLVLSLLANAFIQTVDHAFLEHSAYRAVSLAGQFLIFTGIGFVGYVSVHVVHAYVSTPRSHEQEVMLIRRFGHFVVGFVALLGLSLLAFGHFWTGLIFLACTLFMFLITRGLS